MNKDILEGKWKQIKGHITEEWGELTDDEVDQVNGEFDVLAGKLQEKYGYSKEDAKTKINDFVNRCNC